MRRKNNRKLLSQTQIETADIVAKRNAKLARTVKPTRKSTVRETVVLESRKATVTPIRENLAWLMADVLSTDSGYRA